MASFILPLGNVRAGAQTSDTTANCAAVTNRSKAGTPFFAPTNSTQVHSYSHRPIAPQPHSHTVTQSHSPQPHSPQPPRHHSHHSPQPHSHTATQPFSHPATQPLNPHLQPTVTQPIHTPAATNNPTTATNHTTGWSPAHWALEIHCAQPTEAVGVPSAQSPHREPVRPPAQLPTAPHAQALPSQQYPAGHTEKRKVGGAFTS